MTGGAAGAAGGATRDRPAGECRCQTVGGREGVPLQGAEVLSDAVPSGARARGGAGHDAGPLDPASAVARPRAAAH